jgi:hypothetical protein
MFSSHGRLRRPSPPPSCCSDMTAALLQCMPGSTAVSCQPVGRGVLCSALSACAMRFTPWSSTIDTWKEYGNVVSFAHA